MGETENVVAEETRSQEESSSESVFETSTHKEQTTEELDTPSEKSINELLKEEMKKLQEENANLKDSLARALADFQNLKRRTAMEYATLKRESVKNFVLKILTPIDNLERVLVPNPSEELKPVLDGVKMILSEFRSTLEKEGIFALNAKEQLFDPTFMEAIAFEEREDVSDEVVIEVYRTGYFFQENNEKYPLRPAMVKVAKPKI
ncbi:MAG: nucleotide exchange factor GrpE [Leptospiraceae bacterium]|nr:nucleotide exchange factor GrpE [Leptospiraceae bacterium]